MLTDASALSFLAFPLLYFFMLRPLSLNIFSLERAEKNLQEEIVERKRAETVLRKHVLEQKIIQKVSQIVSSTLNLEIVLQTISDGLAQLLEIETAAIYLLEEEELFLGATTPPLDPQMPVALRRAHLTDHPHILESVSSRLPVILPDTKLANLSPAEKVVVDIRDLRSLLYLPFQQENNVIGVLILGTIHQPREFSAHEIDLCRTIANELALGVQNARLHTGLKKYTIELEAQITDRKKVENQIKLSLKEKETLLQEIHHRVKNNMQVISSLLKLQSDSVDDDRIKEALKVNKNRVFTMSAVHETLYGSDNLSEIDLKSYLSKISEALVQSYSINPGEVSLNIDSEDIKINIAIASPLGLIINELITNSLKYAFLDDRKGEIDIAIKRVDGNDIELIIMDNGIGMGENFDWRKADSLGLKLVTTLVEDQLDGSISMDNKNGTKFIIKFNIA